MGAKMAALEFEPIRRAAVVPFASAAAKFLAVLRTDPPGRLASPAYPSTLVALHVGRSLEIVCRRAGQKHRGRAVHGDIEIVPAGTPSVWEPESEGTSFILSLSPELLNLSAEEHGGDPKKVEIRNRFQLRDPRIEHIGWALKTEMESGYRGGRLYSESLATALASHLVGSHSSISKEDAGRKMSVSGARLRRMMAYIEDHLTTDLGLEEIAGVAGLSVSHAKTVFREAVGLPVHRYVISRRVDRAKDLLRQGRLSIGQVALEAGFAHQSHLARHMRRVLGCLPKDLRKTSR
jgi:AraC family transcriptional regulator